MSVFLLCASLLGSGASALVALRADPGDFGVFYAAGRVAAVGGNAYDTIATTRVARDVEGRQHSAIFLNPPPFLAMVVPLSMLPLAVARVTWMLLLLAAEMGGALLLASVIGWRPAGALEWLLPVALALDFAPFRNALGLGQVDPLIAFAGLAALAATTQGRRLSAGAALAAAALKPQLLGFPGVLMLTIGGRRMMLGLGIALATLVLLTAGLPSLGMGLASWGAWAAQSAGQRPAMAGTGPYILGAGLALLGAAVLRVTRRQTPSPEVMAFALGALLTATAGPFLYLHLQSDILLAIPLALLLARFLSQDEIGRRAEIAMGLLMGVFLGDAIQAISHYTGWKHAALPLAITICILVAVALMRPKLSWGVAAALVANLMLTLVPFPPDFYDRLVQVLAPVVGAWLLLPYLRLAMARLPS